LTPVQEADWSRSFDAPGWSMCPANTAITGLYRSNTTWIYGVEQVRCAGALGSTTRNASAVASWQTSFDSQGWSLCPQNKFIIGLYRSSGHYLYNIEYPNCAELSVPGSTTTSLQWASCHRPESPLRSRFSASWDGGRPARAGRSLRSVRTPTAADR
jgi:hypothetical protein